MTRSKGLLGGAEGKPDASRINGLARPRRFHPTIRPISGVSVRHRGPGAWWFFCMAMVALIWIALICALVALAMDPAAFGRFIGRIVAGTREVAALSLGREA